MATIFFKYAVIYAVISLGGLAIGIFVLLQRQSNQRARIGAGLAIAAIVAFPFLYRYQPALTAAPGHKIQLVTPVNFIESVLKTTAKLSEEQPCRYTLLGWSSTNQLYYQSTCNNVAQIWQYTPVTGNAQPSVALPADLTQIELARGEALSLVRAESANSTTELSNQGVYLPADQPNRYRSPNGQWIAFVTQHLYGPQDIILVSQE